MYMYVTDFMLIRRNGRSRAPLDLELKNLIVQTDAEKMDKGQIYSPVGIPFKAL